MIAAVFAYSQRSINNLNEVREPLQIVTICAQQELVPPLGMIVVDGGRTAEEHKINVANGRSWIKRSRHQDGAAIDVAATMINPVSHRPEVTYTALYYYTLNKAFQKCSLEHSVPLVWGGSWKVKDLMHWELDRKVYP